MAVAPDLKARIESVVMQDTNITVVATILVNGAESGKVSVTADSSNQNQLVNRLRNAAQNMLAVATGAIIQL